MRKLSRETFQRVEDHLMTHSRKLEQARFQYLFKNGSSEVVASALTHYQNEDGGFGHGLEPDFTMPVSSPMASTIGFQIIGEFQGENAEELIKRGISYFEQTFNPGRSGWFALSAEVNYYPHAPWWNYLPEQQMTVIDYSWGNPSAEIIGYLSKYRIYLQKLDVDKLIQYATTYLLQKEEFASEHEVYCFLRMYSNLPVEHQTPLEARLTAAVQSLVKLTPADWEEYTPQPVHFVHKPGPVMFGLSQEAIDTNLDYLIEKLEKHGAILPNWEWGQYPEAWERARTDWSGEMTLRTLKILRNFGRIEG